ncbi:hypothetical protein VPH35_099647 [Triticum aestivum]
MEPVAAAQPSRKARPWYDLPPDLLLNISENLHDASDFIRFHAVCTSWRDLPHSPATRPKFLPWLLRQWYDGEMMHSPLIYSRRVNVSSEASSYDGNILTEPPGVVSTGWDREDRIDRNIVASADGKAVWIFVGAILRPGDAAWMVVEKKLDAYTSHCSGAAYHDGKVLVWTSMYSWCVLRPDLLGNGAHDDDEWWDPYTHDIRFVRVSLCEPGMLSDQQYMRDHSYILEFCGELLRVSVLIKRDWIEYNGYDEDDDDDPSPALSLVVHRLEEGAGGGTTWVMRDGSSLSDCVLFLGSPFSYTADAAQLGVGGGRAYFVLWGRVFRCSLSVDGECEFMKMLRPRWAARRVCVWLQPRLPCPEILRKS